MNRNLDFDFPEDMEEEDIKNLIEMMDYYVVEMPQEDEVNKTIDNLRQFVPKKKKRRSTKVFQAIKMAVNDVSFLSSTYWLVSFGMFVLGLYAVGTDRIDIVNNNNNPYIMAIILSPIPFIFGILEIYKGREEGVMELELSCKMSIGEIMISRIIIVSIYNILLNTILSIVLVHLNSSVIFLRITLMWFTPFTLISGIGLFLVAKLRGSLVTTIFTSIWMIFSISILLQREIADKMMEVNIVVYIVLSILGTVIFLFQMRGYLNRNNTFYEGGVLGEIRN